MPPRPTPPGPLGLVQGPVEGAAVEAQAILAAQTELDLDQAELQALEAGRRKQHVAELEEVERRHSLQHVDLLQEQALDPADPLERLDGESELAVVGHRAGEDPVDPGQLEQDLFEPQLVGLMDDDEQHLVVRRPPGQLALTLLAVEQPVELQMLAIAEALLHVHRIPLVPVAGRHLSMAAAPGWTLSGARSWGPVGLEG